MRSTEQYHIVGEIIFSKKSGARTDLRCVQWGALGKLGAMQWFWTLVRFIRLLCFCPRSALCIVCILLV
jgi:hypothetical protein